LASHQYCFRISDGVSEFIEISRKPAQPFLGNIVDGSNLVHDHPRKKSAFYTGEKI
jgi:hypothetical protein